MTPKDWELLKPVFGRALSLPPEERAAFVEQFRAENADLGRNLAELISEEASGGLDGPLVNLHNLFSRSPEANFRASAAQTITMTDPHPSQILAGRFRIVRHIGKGGMGEVFEAQDLQLKDRVALKVIRPEISSNPQAAARFKREILLGKRIAHPNVCRIHDLGSAPSNDGTELLFLTMEFLEGETLASRIERGPLTPTEALPLIENMADGLTAAHNAGIVHRDFKSGNVMLVASSVGPRAVITDFGLARAVHETEERGELTRPGVVAGTVAYMAPEQLRGKPVTPSSDLYSLGVVMFEMITGRLPFTGDSGFEIALQHLYAAPPSPRQFVHHLDTRWETAILGCLKKAPEERFGFATEVKAALSGSAPERRKPAWARRKLALAALPIAVVGLSATGLWIYQQKISGSSDAQQRVAVLEFDNVGGDPANRAFCEGLMETLSSQLSELEPFQNLLSVVPASDIRRDSVTSAREAQRDFGVTLVITGSVQRSPSGMRLTINVVDAHRLQQLRSHTIFIPQTDALSMQQGAVAQVTDLLDLQLRPEAQRRLAQGNTAVPGAYDFYLQGTGYLLTGALRTDQAITEFRHALDLDPGYALAYAGLGQAYWSKYQATKDKIWITQAWDACHRALALNPSLAASHITLAILNNGTGHYADAMQEAQQAIAIDPTNFQAYSELASAQERTHQLLDAEATLKSAISRRPSYWNSYARLGSFYQRHGRYKNAEPLFQHLIELVPDNPAGYTDLGVIYHLEGREQDAVAILNKSIQVRPTQQAYSNLGTVYFFLARFADAVPIYEHLVEEGTKNYLIWGNLGDAYRWAPGMRPKSLHAYDVAIQFANQALSVNPLDPQALSSLALYQAKSGQLAPALANSAKALADGAGDSGLLFNAAIVSEIAGKRDTALSYLSKAAKSGYSKSEIQVEPELQGLRKDERYSKLKVISPDK